MLRGRTGLEFSMADRTAWLQACATFAGKEKVVSRPELAYVLQRLWSREPRAGAPRRRESLSALDPYGICFAGELATAAL